MSLTGTIIDFTAAQGFGRLRLDDGRELTFDGGTAVCRLGTVLEPGLRIAVTLGTSARTGREKVIKLWLEGTAEPGLPPKPPKPPPPPSPEQIYSAFHAARLVGDLDGASFHALCVRARDEIPEITNHWEHAAQALRQVYGDKGPTKKSMQSDLFILPTMTVMDSKLKRKVASALQQWMGQPFPEKNQEDQKDAEMSLDAMLAYAGDAIYLRYAHNFVRYPHGVMHVTRYLFSRTLRGAVVYLLREGPVSGLGRYLQLHLSESLDDLLDGKFPDDGNVPRAFRDHAEKCAECRHMRIEDYEDGDCDDASTSSRQLVAADDSDDEDEDEDEDDEDDDS